VKKRKKTKNIYEKPDFTERIEKNSGLKMAIPDVYYK
jgi:hypothetical protein